MNPRIMGIDPGLQSTGFGIIEIEGPRIRLIEGGVVKTTPKTPLASRLECIHREIKGVLVQTLPDMVVVEDLFTNYTHPQTAVLMGHARGAILLAAASEGIPVEVYTASMVKRALTGNGRASKVQVANMVGSLLSIDTVKVPDHVTDALALALCHHNIIRTSSLMMGGR